MAGDYILTQMREGEEVVWRESPLGMISQVRQAGSDDVVALQHFISRGQCSATDLRLLRATSSEDDIHERSRRDACGC